MSSVSSNESIICIIWNTLWDIAVGGAVDVLGVWVNLADAQMLAYTGVDNETVCGTVSPCEVGLPFCSLLSSASRGQCHL